MVVRKKMFWVAMDTSLRWQFPVWLLTHHHAAPNPKLISGDEFD